MDDKLTIDDMFKLVDLYYKQRYVMYSHLHNSYNKCIDDRIRNLFENGEHVFYEKTTPTNIYKYKFVYTDLTFRPPRDDAKNIPIFPSDARTNNLTYSIKLMATITQVQEIIDLVTDIKTTKVIGEPEKDHVIAVIPVMVRSAYCSTNLVSTPNRECINDPGGYFIVNGSEKVVITSERMIENKPLVFLKKKASVASYNYQVALHSKSFINDEMMQKVNILMEKEDRIILQVPILEPINIFIMFRALGIERDKQIIDLIVEDKSDIDMINIIKNSLMQAVDQNNKRIYTKEHAFEFLLNKIRVKKNYTETDEVRKKQEKIIFLNSLLKHKFIPHTEPDEFKKAFCLGYMLNKLLQCYLNRRPPDNRDSYENKRLETVGDHFYDLLKQFQSKKILLECKKVFTKRNKDDKDPINIINTIKTSTIELGLKKALSTGIWGKKKGVAQMLQRLTFLQTTSTFRRINSPTTDAATDKLTGPRHYDPSQAGFLCAVESPEGHKIGLIKHLNMITSVTIPTEDIIDDIREQIISKVENIYDVNIEDLGKYTKVSLNGNHVGLTLRPKELYDELLELKRNGVIERHTSIIFEIRSEIESKEIKISCDGGRLIKPVIRVTNNELLLKRSHIDKINNTNYHDPNKINTWNEFLENYKGVIEYIDVDTAANNLIAIRTSDVELMKKQELDSIDVAANTFIDSNHTIVNRYDNSTFAEYNYCEIEPSLLLGIIAANIPFCNHNAGARCMFQFAQAKQAMGIYASNYRDRIDISYILYNPQRPLVNTRAMKYIGTTELPYGENAMVAFLCYTGYNQEDSLLFNRSAIESGFFCISSYKKYDSTIQKNQITGQDDLFMKPDKSKVSTHRKCNYDKVNEAGYVEEETYVENGDILIAKVKPIEPEKGKIYKDDSKFYKSGVPAHVDKVVPDVSDNSGYGTIKIKTRSMRIPMIGDKFCCYTPDHEVLTMDGWKPIADIKKTDKVATLNNERELTYRYPIKIMQYNVENEEMYVVENHCVNLKVTKNHEMYVTCDRNKNRVFRKMKAEDIIGAPRYYLKNCKRRKHVVFSGFSYENDKIHSFKLFDHVYNKDFTEATPSNEYYDIPIEPFLYLFGIFIAEGSVKIKYVGNEGKIVQNFSCVQIACHKPRVYGKVIECLEKIGISYYATYDCAKDTVKIPGMYNTIWIRKLKDGELGEFFCKYFFLFSTGATHKFLPEWVWYLPSDLAKILIMGMMLGDGHVDISEQEKKKGNGEEIAKPDYTGNEKDNAIKYKNYCKLVTSDYKNMFFKGGYTMLYDTSSIQLRDDFQKLCLHAGYSAHFYIKDKKGSVREFAGKKGKQCRAVSTADHYRIKVITAQNEPLINKKRKGVENADKYEIYTGKVHCCEMPPNTEGVIYVRRKGIPVWCGNSRSGQKGTIGLILRRHLFPFTKHGISPDIIFNPNGLPTRMTIGQLLEAVCSKVSAIEGHDYDGTPFIPYDFDSIAAKLEEYGYNKYGYEEMYSGITGKKIKSLVFFCPTYYLRLKHLVKDKIHARARGAVQLITKQAPEGRVRDGGLRFGEMERDCMIAHGMAIFLKERLVNTADYFLTRVCDICGLFAQRKKTNSDTIEPKDVFQCPLCKTSVHITKIVIPYAFKLFLQEIMSANVKSRILTPNSFRMNN